MTKGNFNQVRAKTRGFDESEVKSRPEERLNSMPRGTGGRHKYPINYTIYSMFEGWEAEKTRVLNKKKYRCKIMASNPDMYPEYAIAHPDEVKDAKDKIYTKMNIRLKDEQNKYIKRLQDKEKKLGKGKV